MKFKNLEIKENVDLREYVTFRVGGEAKYLAQAESVEDLSAVFDFIKEKGLEWKVMGRGSNLVVSDRGYQGIIILFRGDKLEKIEEKGDKVRIRVGAGEIGDEVVEFAVRNNWWGVENMSGIPGTIGGWMVQNAGAYGQEIGEVVEAVKVFDVERGAVEDLNREECEFGYRESRFKGGGYVILEVILTLKHLNTETLKHLGKLDYPSLKKYFEDKNNDRPAIGEIREAVLAIRGSKLPRIEEVGSAGSFFKNVWLSESEYLDLEKKVKENVGDKVLSKLREMKDRFKSGKGIKIPAAWLVDICGLKGARAGGAGIYEKQPLVIINEKEATASDVMNLMKKIRQTVYSKTGIVLKPEPEMVGFNQEELDGCFRIDG